MGPLDDILSAAAEGKIKGKRGQNLVEHADNARLSKDLATIRTDVPVDVVLEDLAPRGVQEAPLREMFDDWEFMEVATKLCRTRSRSTSRSTAGLGRVRSWMLCSPSSGPGPIRGVAADHRHQARERDAAGVAFAIDDDVAYVPLARGDRRSRRLMPRATRYWRSSPSRA